MSRKDFVLIAATINKMDIGWYTKVEVAKEMATALATTNPRFNRSRFIEAATKDK